MDMFDAEMHTIKELINASADWHDSDMPLEVVLLAKQADIPKDVIREASERSVVDFEERYNE